MYIYIRKMPYFMSFIPNRKWKCWTVRKRRTKPNAKGRKIFARCTTKIKALKQLRLLRALQINPKFRANRQKTAKKDKKKNKRTSKRNNRSTIRTMK